jgi:hypothetical protein
VQPAYPEKHREQSLSPPFAMIYPRKALNDPRLFALTDQGIVSAGNVTGTEASADA